MRIIIKPMGAVLIAVSLFGLGAGTLYGIRNRAEALPSTSASPSPAGSVGSARPAGLRHGPSPNWGQDAVKNEEALETIRQKTLLPPGFRLSPDARVYQAEEARMKGPLVLDRFGSTPDDVAIRAANNSRDGDGGNDGSSDEQRSAPKEAAQTRASRHTGTGFADYQNYTGDYIEWTVTAPSDGVYRLIFRYAAATGRGIRALRITHGGAEGRDAVAAERLVFPNFGNWDTWGVAVTTARLQTGPNKIRASACSSSGPNIDALIVDR